MSLGNPISEHFGQVWKAGRRPTHPMAEKGFFEKEGTAGTAHGQL